MTSTASFTADGIHWVSILAVDRAGNYSQNSVSVSVLTTPPRFSVIITPNDIRVETVLSVSIFANQALNYVPEINLSINATLYPFSMSRLSDSTFVATLDTRSFVDGIGEVLYRVAGNSGKIKLTPEAGATEIIAHRALPLEPDLIIINPKSDPQVAKIMDYGQFRYQKEK